MGEMATYSAQVYESVKSKARRYRMQFCGMSFVFEIFVRVLLKSRKSPMKRVQIAA
jgi:hypothetical protein